MAIFALGIAGLATAAAMVAPPASPPPAVAKSGAPSPLIATREAEPPRPAPQPGMMISHSHSGPAVTIPGTGRPPPPIVAIPRIPGPADMTIIGDRPGEVVTIRSFPSNEACDEALPAARRRYSDAVCVSTTPPPPPPEHGYLVEVDVGRNEIVGLETFPSMRDCERTLASRPAKPGHQAACTPRLH